MVSKTACQWGSIPPTGARKVRFMDYNIGNTMSVLLNRKALVDDIRMGVVCRVFPDVRDFAEQVVKNALPGQKVYYLPASKQLQWDNGAVAFLFSAQEPDSMRGFQWAFSMGFDAHEWPEKVFRTVKTNTCVGPNAECIVLY